MKKYIFIFCLFTLAVSCSKDSNESEVETINPNDLDGDGVTNEIEIVDGTNPEDPCSVFIGHIYYPNLSQAWKLLDCDGDGVTNWDEMDPDGNGSVENNGTSPMDECSVIVENQTLTPSEYWSNLDCDSDGFSNGQEVLDNTDLNDLCDFIIGNQDLEFQAFWLELDCDEDGRYNGQEITQGTDPLDPNDFLGKGDFLTEIIQVGYRRHLYSQNGTRYERSLDNNGALLVTFEYDSQNKLVSVINNNSSVLYEYQNDQISLVTITENSNQTILNVMYDENIIYTYDGSEPVGQFRSKFTLDPNSGKVIQKERFYPPDNGTIVYTSILLNYDSTFKNLLLESTSIFGYNTSTGEFYDYYPTRPNPAIKESYSYSTDVRNPVFESSQNFYINFMLSSSILEYGYLLNNTAKASFSENYLSNYYYWTQPLSSNFGYSVRNVQTNGLPVLGSYGNIGLSSVIEFYYE